MRYLKKSIVAVVSVLCVAASVLGVVRRQDIRDWFVLRDYSPPDRIAALANATTMTDISRKYFYVHKPELLDKTQFLEKCESGEQTIVLGCYIQYQGIYIFDVTDERLKGIHEITAAHEMLHAAYDRLGSKERERVNQMLNEAFKNSNNKRINDTVESYRSKDPSVVTNELHSILGTEERNLPGDLENYYKKYFQDRSHVVSISEQYEQEFSRRAERIKTLEDELEAMRPRIESSKAELSLQRSLLDSERNRLDTLLQANRIDEYNAAVAGYNQRVVTYNTAVKRLQDLVNDFNAKVEEHNLLASEQKGLIQAIDARVDTKSLK